MITIFFLWLFMPFILLLLTIGAAGLALKWLFCTLDKSLEESDKNDSNIRR